MSAIILRVKPSLQSPYSVRHVLSSSVMQVDREAESPSAAVGELQAWVAHAWNRYLCEFIVLTVLESVRVDVERDSCCALSVNKCTEILCYAASQYAPTPFLIFWRSTHLIVNEPTFSPSSMTCAGLLSIFTST